jgi:hypothetical protein
MMLGCRTQEALVIPPEPTPLPPVTAIIDPPTPTPVIEAPAAAPTATLTTVTETSVTNLADYAQSLETAINQRDVDPLGQMMSQPFYIGGWRSEWRQYDRDAALTELQHHYPPAEAAIQFSPLETDLSLMLDGQPVQMMLGPDLNVVSAIHSTGWGSDGQNEAILFCLRRWSGPSA